MSKLPPLLSLLSGLILCIGLTGCNAPDEAPVDAAPDSEVSVDVVKIDPAVTYANARADGGTPY